MSSREVEREIVQMEFDARKFSKGVAGGMKDLEDFKKSFNFNNAQHSLAELDKASEGVDFSGMGQGLQTVTAQFSAMGIVGFTVLNRLTNAAIDFGKNLVNSVVVDPVKTGLEEYETQLGAIQTILANTRRYGTTLPDVNDALDELNNYADLTIYNFTQMTDAIGRFTTAGIDLDTSVQAIKGLSNVAALSGANAEEAARGQYQLSQALSSGIIRLQDWMSLENANIAGQTFRDSLIETAKLYGVNVDEMIEKNGSFRLTLQENWLTADIMLETLSKFTGELSDEQLRSLGYTDEQIVGIQDTATTALDAATKIKTITQLVDVLKEQLQSGWALTWRTVFGDFEEAKDLWGGVAEVLGGILQEQDDARNRVLKNWALAGGRDTAVTALFDVLKGGVNIIHAFKEAVSDIFKPLSAIHNLIPITDAIGKFALRFRMATNELDTFKRIVRGVAAILDIALRVIAAILRPMIDLVKMAAEGSGGFIEWVATIADAIVAWREFAIENDLFNKTVSDVIGYVDMLIKRALLLVDAFLELGIVKDIGKLLKDLSANRFEKVLGALNTVVRLIVGPVIILGLALKDLVEEFLKLEIVQKVVTWFKELRWDDVKDSFWGLADSVKEFFNSIKNSEILAKFVTLIKTFDGRRVETFLKQAGENFSWLGDIIDSIREKISGLNVETKGFNVNIGALGETIKNGIVKALDWLIDNAENIDYSAIFNAINSGLLAAVLLSLRKLASGAFLGDAIEPITESISGALKGVEGALTSYQTNVKADALQKIAIAIAIFAGSLFLLTLLDTTKLQAASLTIAAMLGTLFGSSAIMSKIKTQDVAKTSVAIVGLSFAMAIASIGLSKISKIDPERVTASLAAMGAGLTALVLSVNSIKGGNKALSNVFMLLGISVALTILASSIEKFGSIEPEVLAQGLKSIGIVLGGFVVYTRLINPKGMIEAGFALTIIASSLLILKKAVESFGNFEDQEIITEGLRSIGLAMAGFAAYSRLVKPEGMIKAGIGIAIISASLLILGEAIKNIGGIDQDTLIQGLIGIAAGLLILVIAANLMTGALAGAAAVLVMSIAITAMAIALKLLSTLSIEELLIALAALAGVFIILGVAGLLLTPLVPVLLGLGAAMFIIGAGAALLGAGVFLAATGLVALAAAGAGVAGAIAIVGLAVAEVLPKLAKAFAEAIVSFLTVIAENTPAIMEAFRTIVLGLITTVTELIPNMVTAILDMITAILQAIANALPNIIQSGYDILLAFIQGIEDNIADIIAAGLGVLTEFINGIADGLPDLVDSAFNLILVFLNSIADAIEEYMADIIAAGIRIGEAIIEGVGTAIANGIPVVQRAIRRLVDKALSALTGSSGFDTDSPSKVTYKIGGYVVLGLVKAFEDGISTMQNALQELTRAAANELTPLQYALSEAVDEEWEFNPIIRPVVDLDNIARSDRLLNGFFRNVRISPEEADYIYEGPDVGSTRRGETTGVTFIQNNYSPKALDRATIYRETKTHVAQIERRMLES